MPQQYLGDRVGSTSRKQNAAFVGLLDSTQFLDGNLEIANHLADMFLIGADARCFIGCVLVVTSNGCNPRIGLGRLSALHLQRRCCRCRACVGTDEHRHQHQHESLQHLLHDGIISRVPSTP